MYLVFNPTQHNDWQLYSIMYHMCKVTYILHHNSKIPYHSGNAHITRLDRLFILFQMSLTLSFTTRSRPQYSGQSFNLLTTFPNKTLTDTSQTIEGAKLMNAVIVQRLTQLLVYLFFVLQFTFLSLERQCACYVVLDNQTYRYVYGVMK